MLLPLVEVVHIGGGGHGALQRVSSFPPLTSLFKRGGLEEKKGESSSETKRSREREGTVHENARHIATRAPPVFASPLPLKAS